MLEWRRIKKTLTNFINQTKANVRAHERKDVLIDRFATVISMLDEIAQDLPRIDSSRYIDVILSPQVKKVLGVPDGRTITDAAFARLRQAIPAIWAQWKTDVEASLASEFRILLPIFQSFGTLDHPAAIFTCMDCDSVPALTYDNVFVHKCHGKTYFPPPKGSDVASAMILPVYEHAARDACRHTKWRHNLGIHPAAKRALDLMRLCEVDPNCTNSGEMDKLDVRVHCLMCASRGRAATMGWRTAVRVVFP